MSCRRNSSVWEKASPARNTKLFASGSILIGCLLAVFDKNGDGSIYAQLSWQWKSVGVGLFDLEPEPRLALTNPSTRKLLMEPQLGAGAHENQTQLQVGSKTIEHLPQTKALFLLLAHIVPYSKQHQCLLFDCCISPCWPAFWRAFFRFVPTIEGQKLTEVSAYIEMPLYSTIGTQTW